MSVRGSTEPVSRAEVAQQVAEELIEEYRERVSTVAEFAALHTAATNVVAEAVEQDELLAERRDHARECARHWRQRLPGLID